jgi:type IV secretion system protein VirD4
MSKTGVVLGRFQGRTLRFDGPENVLLVGPARSGKGVGVLIPSILELGQEHLIIIDIRGETWDATAGYRNTLSRCLRLSLMGQQSARFSLPQAIRKRTPYAFMDAAILAEAAMEAPDDTTKENPHWQGTARAALTCALLYEAYARVRPTMTQMASFWSQPGKTARDIVTHVRDTAPTREVAELAQELLNKEPREASSVLSTMTRQLFLYRDPLVARNTATCDFHLEDFTRHDVWTSLYIVLSPEEEHYLRPFLRMFLRLALGRWLERGPTKHRMTLVLDEFHTFGRLQFYADELGVLGGRGIRTLIAVQNIPQLQDTYGNADLITEQCKVRLFFAANGQQTGREISRQTGTGTALTPQTSYRAKGWSWMIADDRTQQEHVHGRPLLTESEAMQLPEDRVIIQVAGHPPIWGTKVKFWEHRTWRQRSQIPAPGGHALDQGGGHGQS